MLHHHTDLYFVGCMCRCLTQQENLNNFCTSPDDTDLQNNIAEDDGRRVPYDISVQCHLK